MKAHKSAGQPKSDRQHVSVQLFLEESLRAMTIDRPAATVTAAAIAPATLPYSVRQRIFLYLGILIVLLAFGAPPEG